jgi:hypothetical protein
MLKCASIYTCEIDDPETAFQEVKSQLDEKLALLDHTVGIIMCHPEFINSGVLRHICENLPFDLVGVTTSSQAVNGEAGELILTIFVMTSDDVRFRTGVTGAMDESIDAPVKTAFDKASSGVDESPKLAIIFPPIIINYAGDDYISAWQKLIPDTPIYGTLAMDDTPAFTEAETIYNGECFKTSMPFILCYGNITPRFIIGTFPEDRTMPYKGEVTKSNGPFVHEINNMNASQYFESIGFIKEDVPVVNYLFVPFAIDQKKRADYDGTPVIRVIASFTDDGSAIFHGAVDEGSTFSILTCALDDVLSTTNQSVEEINGLTGVNGVLLFSCIVRRVMTIPVNSMMELEIVRDTINPGIPFMMGYAGGEICPTLIRDGVPTNRYHNYSLVILVI